MKNRNSNRVGLLLFVDDDNAESLNKSDKQQPAISAKDKCLVSDKEVGRGTVLIPRDRQQERQ